MNTAFARRLAIITALEIAVVLDLLIVAGALFGFGSYIATVKSDLNATLNQLVIATNGTPAASSGRAAAGVAAARFLRSDLMVIVFDRGQRIDVYRPNRADPEAVVRIARRGEPFPGAAPPSPFAQPLLGLATAFGLQPVRAHVGSIDLLVRESDAAIVRTCDGFLLPFFCSLALGVAVGFVFARFLTLQALRPLVEVTEALERFAAGDLTPQPIAADRRHQLGQLAVAYNGAIAQMEHAFAERDRANAAIRQFIADAGHQLRTPLTVVRGFIAILRKGELRSPADRERILETMNRQALVMGSLIEKLMLLDRWANDPDAAPPEPIDVGRLVWDVVSPIAEASPARTVRIDEQTGELAAIDPSDLTYALTNLVDNALKYTSGAIGVRVLRSGSRIVVEVQDQGPGMSPDEARHAFDRFFRGTRRDVDGSGLGLAIARRAIERAGGTLTLESDPLTGSSFTISLPAAQRKPAPPPPVVLAREPDVPAVRVTRS
jgi:signal transduction histidine kinase